MENHQNIGNTAAGINIVLQTRTGNDQERKKRYLRMMSLNYQCGGQQIIQREQLEQQTTCTKEKKLQPPAKVVNKKQSF